MALFRTKGRIRREAADWLARKGAGADGEDHAAFERWYRTDRRHAEAYDRLAAIWSAADRIAAPRTVEASEDPAVPARRPRRRTAFALAACLVAGIGIVLVLLASGPWLSDERRSAPLSYASALGEIRQVALPDGSGLILDSASRVDVEISGSARLLTLREGRARFIVAHESRPFIVRAASNEVVATGTVFDVSLIENRLAVVMLEGSVEVRPQSGDGVRRLQAGDRLEIGENPPERRRASRGEVRWPSRMLEFDDTPLREASALVNRYSRTQLRLGSDRIGALRVSGAYRAGDVAGFARSLAAAFGLRLETQPDGTILLAEPEPAGQ